MTTSINKQSEFSGRVNVYSARPHWPDQFMKKNVAQIAGITPDSTLAEFGSGTGNSAAYFVKEGVTVYGVDRSPGMRNAISEKFPGFSNFTSIDGTAAEPNLTDVQVDFILAAQAAHWWYGEKEQVLQAWQRILKLAGKVVGLSYNVVPDLLTHELQRFFTENWAPYRESIAGFMDAPGVCFEHAILYRSGERLHP